jgi:hypothetical protein
MSGETWDGKTGLLRQVLADTADARVEVAELGVRVDGLASDHRELNERVQANYASLHEGLADATAQLRWIRAWSAAACVLVPGSIVGTVGLVAYLLSKIPPAAWASIMK